MMVAATSAMAMRVAPVRRSKVSWSVAVRYRTNSGQCNR